MRARRTPVALPALAALAVLLSGCSGSGDSGNSGGTDAAEKDSPLTAYLNSVYGGDLSPEEQEKKFAEEQDAQEVLIAECMQEQGFEYTPADTAGMFSAGDAADYEPDDREWVAEYGYGAVKTPYDDMPAPEEEYVDPNEGYVSSLSESEQMAFYEALHGPQPTEEEMSEGGEFEYDWTTAGCQGAAQHEVAGEDLSQSAEFKQLFEAVDELYTDMASWPGMAELDGEWADCMDAAGQGGHASPMEAQTSIYDDVNEVYESLAPSEDGSFDEAAQEAALDEVGAREVELALADLDCREETDYSDRAAEITREVEQQFVDDHETELEALKAAAEQGGS